MPTIKSGKPAAVAQNIRTEVAAGRPLPVAVAIAERIKDVMSKRKKRGKR